MGIRGNKPPVSDEEFVVIWQRATYTAQVAELCGYTTASAKRIVSHRASRLRSRGVPLKRHRAPTSLAKLTWLAERAAQDAQEGNGR